MKRMTGLKDLGIMIPRFIIPELPPLTIRSLLLTSKGIHTILSPSMDTVYQAHFPNDPIDPNAPKNKSYSTQRFLARTGASQVYVWGKNEGNNLCLRDPRLEDPDERERFEYSREYAIFSPIRSEMLSHLGVKKLACKRNSLVALSLEGKVYITNDKDTFDYRGRPMPPARLFEMECPEVIVDVVSGNIVVALSETGRLYAWGNHEDDEPPTRPPYKLREVDLQSAFELENQPRILSMSSDGETVACMLEDGRVVVWTTREFPNKSYAPPAAIAPRVSSSLEPDCKVVDVAIGTYSIVLVLANGHIYTVKYGLASTDLPDGTTNREYSFETPKPFKLLGPVERVWCTYSSLFALSREKGLFEIDCFDLNHSVHAKEPRKLEGIDTAHISTIVGNNYELAFILMDDGTCYVWGETDIPLRSLFGRGPMEVSKVKDDGYRYHYETKSEEYLIRNGFYIQVKMPQKISLKHIVSVATSKYQCAAIVVDPNEVDEPDEEEAARLAMKSLLVTSKSVYTVTSPSMGTAHQEYSPNDPMEPKVRIGGPFYTRRFLARAEASQVYVWGYNDDNDICLSNTLPEKTVYFPTRSEMLCRLGVKKLAFGQSSLVALSLEGKVYVTNDRERILEGDMSPRLFELECPEVIVDVVASDSFVITALSDTKRLYTWGYGVGTEPPNKLVEVDLQSALGLPNQPRVLTLSPGERHVACIVEDVGVVLWRNYNKPKKGYTPEVVPIPTVSNSLEPDWTVVDIGVGEEYLVLLLANGHIYTVNLWFEGKYHLNDTDDRITADEPKRINLPDVERVWCWGRRFYALSRTKRLFEIVSTSDPEDLDIFEPIDFQEPIEVEGIDGTRISTVAMGDDHELFLMEDGTLYVSKRGYMVNSNIIGFGPDDRTHYEPQKLNIKHVVCIAAGGTCSAAIVKDPNEVHEADEAEAARSPNDPIERHATNNGTYYIRRLLARTSDSQVYVWGDNYNNGLCLWERPPQKIVYSPTRSEMLSRLGVKKLAFPGYSIVALSLEGRVYITDNGEKLPEGCPIPPVRLFELECPEVIVDVVADCGVITALSDTKRLYTWDIRDKEPPYKLVEADLQRALGLPNQPRFLTLSAGFGYVAFVEEDVGVVVWKNPKHPKEGYTPEVVPIPTVSNSLEPDWKVVDVGAGNKYLVLLLANGHIYTVQLDNRADGIIAQEPKRFNFPDVERVWCGGGRFYALSRTKRLFEIVSTSDPEGLDIYEPIDFQEPIEVEGIDGTRISTVAMGDDHELFLMEDGTLYVSGRGYMVNSDTLGFGPDDGTHYEPQKLNIKHVVCIAAGGTCSAAIVKDPNEVHEADEESSCVKLAAAVMVSPAAVVVSTCAVASLAMRPFLVTSKSICTVTSPSMGTLHREYPPNDSIEPKVRVGGPFYTRRLLARTEASQVYVWGENYKSSLCLSNTFPEKTVYFPTRSEMLCRLGVKKLIFGVGLFALSLEGKVYVTRDGEPILEGDPSPRLLELECPEVIVDMVACYFFWRENTVITALSDTGRLYTWDSGVEKEPPYKLVEVDLQRALGLPNQPRFRILSARKDYVAFVEENVGVVVWKNPTHPKKGYIPEVVSIPTVSNSLEPDWKVVDVGAGNKYLVLLLANGHIYTVQLDKRADGIIAQEPKRFNLPDVERVWCGGDRFFVLSRTKSLFEIDAIHQSELRVMEGSSLFHEPREVEGIDGTRISTVAIGDYHELFLMEDGTLYVSGGGYYADLDTLGLGPKINASDEPQKLNIKHVVCIAVGEKCSAAIVKDPNDAHEPDEAEAARSPNDPIERNATNNGTYYIRRLLARTAASQVYVWGDNYNNGLCLWERPPQKIVYSPTRSEMLSRLGVKKLAFPGYSIVALSLEGRVYITDNGEKLPEGCPIPPVRLFELECPEVIVDVVADCGLITALSDTKRLYTWDIRDKEPPYKLVEVDLQRALGLPNQPRFRTLSAGFGYVAFVEEDVGVVVWRNPKHPKEGYTPDILPIPKVSNSLEPDWKVVDVGAGNNFLVLLLANGHIYTVQLDNRADGIVAQEPTRFNLPDVERVWCGEDRFFVLSRTKSLFEIDSIYDSERPVMEGPIKFYEPREVQGIDGTRISAVAMGTFRELFLMEDGSLYVSARGRFSEREAQGDSLEPQGETPCKPQKLDLEHVVSVAACGSQCAAIVKDPNELGEDESARECL